MLLSPKRLLRALLISLWFMILVFPVMGIKISKKAYAFLPERVLIFGCIVFAIAIFWTWYFDRRENGMPEGGDGPFLSAFKSGASRISGSINSLQSNRSLGRSLMAGALLFFVVIPHVTSMYQTTILALAFIYVMLALGLNIIVGIAGQLVLGYAAFYAVGAYTYALLNQYFGLGFWTCLPIAGSLAVIAGVLIGFPVLRLRGDYLAIVTLGFGEITRLLLTNLSGITGGAKGITKIPRPALFGIELSPDMSSVYVYYLALLAAIVTIVVVARLRDSRVGLALQALREDEIASEAMGINISSTKLQAFALCSCWAGFAGVLLAARNNYINPQSFSFMDSCMILSAVVLGGMGSIWGVVIGAMLLTLMPEYLRAFSEYRMLLFGALMVVMMLFRPQGMIPPAKRIYRPKALTDEGGDA